MEDYDPIKLPKNADPDKYSYSGYAVGFDVRSTFSLTDDSGFGKNVTIFGVDKSFSRYADNRKKDILILGKNLTNELDDTTVTAELNTRLILVNNNKKIA